MFTLFKYFKRNILFSNINNNIEENPINRKVYDYWTYIYEPY